METGVPELMYAAPNMPARCWYFSGLNSWGEIKEAKGQYVIGKEKVMFTLARMMMQKETTYRFD